MLNQEVVIKNETGVHARPASVLTQLATSFVSDIKFVREGVYYDAKSIINVLSMGLKFDEKVTLEVDGIDETDAIKAIVELIDNHFGESL